MWILLFLASFFGTYAVRFSVQNGEYIQLCCGEPCTWKTFRLNRTSSEIWLHNLAYITASRTYYQSQSGLDDSELFYFNDVNDVIRVRLKMRYFPIPPVLVGKTSMSIDGTLGLGHHSELWTIWNNYTLTNKRLELGSYDPYGQRDYRQRPPVLALNQNHQVQLGDGALAYMDFNIATTDSYVPYGTNLTTVFQSMKITSQNCKDMYHQIGMKDVSKCDDEITIYPDQFQRMTLSNGIEYEAIDYTEGDKVVIGTRFVDDFFWFRSMDANCVILTEDAFFLDYIGATVGSSIMITILVAIWAVIAEAKQDRAIFYEQALMLAGEALCYIIDFMIFIVTFGMLDWTRYLTQFSQCNEDFAVVFIGFTFLVSLGLYFAQLFQWESSINFVQDFKRTSLFRATFFGTSQGLFVWLCIVEQHETTFDRLFVSLIITAVCVYQLYAAGRLFIERQYIPCGAICALIFFTNLFHVMYNLIPVFKYGNTRHSFGIMCFMWIYFLELVPAFFILSATTMKRALEALEKQIHDV